MKYNKVKSIKVSIIINILIFVMTVISAIIMFTGYKFMHGYEIILESTKIGMFRFFTIDSNIMMGIVALIFAIKEIQFIKGKNKDISKKYYIIKLMATTAVALTFFIVFAYLGHIAKGGIMSLLMNSNLFFHFIIPLFSILNFVLFEKNNKIDINDTFYGIIPTLVYGIYYLENVLIHMENGKVSPIYDWYWFVQNGVWTALIVAPVIVLVTYAISLILWRLNRKRR